MDLKDLYTKIFLKESDIDISDEVLQSYKTTWWFNLRSKNTGGLRLTVEGINFVKENSKIKTYEVELPEDVKHVPQLLIWLDKFIQSPYFIDKKKIIITDEKLAFELYLFSGDVRKMGLAKAVRSRIV
jgi:hypothetical protein